MPIQAPPSPPINRFYHQLIRDRYLTFRQKYRDLIMQIFGHEMLIGKQEMADITHCIIFNIDFYRLNRITWEHMAWRKLFNPFKWIELLIIAPLELLSWSISRLTMLFKLYLKEKAKNREQAPSAGPSFLATLFLGILYRCLLIIAPLFNLTINSYHGYSKAFFGTRSISYSPCD